VSDEPECRLERAQRVERPLRLRTMSPEDQLHQACEVSPLARLACPERAQRVEWARSVETTRRKIWALFIRSASEGSSRSSQPRPPTTFYDPSLTLRMMIVHGSLQRPGVDSQLFVNNLQVHPLMDGALARRGPTSNEQDPDLETTRPFIAHFTGATRRWPAQNDTRLVVVRQIWRNK
jgi:hypothetical protein